MKLRLLAVLACAMPIGCAGYESVLKDPAAIQALDGVARAAAEKAALDTAGKFQITDESAVKRLVDEAKAAATNSVNAAVTRLEAQDRVAREQWRAQTMATISASLQGVGGALSMTGNPILMGLGALMGIGSILTSRKKEEKTA